MSSPRTSVQDLEYTGEEDDASLTLSLVSGLSGLIRKLESGLSFPSEVALVARMYSKTWTTQLVHVQ